METLLELFKDELPTQILSVFILLVVPLHNIGLRQNLRVGTMYAVSFATILLGWVNIGWGVAFLLLAEFVLLEIFTDDVEKQALFGLRYKVVDCLYRLFVEYYFALYLVALGVLLIGTSVLQNCETTPPQEDISCWICGWQKEFAAGVTLLASAFILSAILCVARMKFETKSVSDIMKSLRAVNIYSLPIEPMGQKFQILVDFEDRTFFQRKWSSHTVLSPLIMRGALKYINSDTLKRPWQTAQRVFSRGYGTIEMQLIRNIGVERGYDRCVLRRKVFEMIYSTLIFNSYHRQFAKHSESVENYQYWILWCYIQKVPVKFSRRFFPTNLSTAQQIFGKGFTELSLEEFFVWCISLEFLARIGPKTIKQYESIIATYGLRERRITDALECAYGAE